MNKNDYQFSSSFSKPKEFQVRNKSMNEISHFFKNLFAASSQLSSFFGKYSFFILTSSKINEDRLHKLLGKFSMKI